LDDTYETYVNRVARMTLPETFKSQVQHIQPSPKFQRQDDGTFQAVAFPGYSVITPPWLNESENSEFYNHLQQFQQQVLHHLSADFFIPLPPDSFHMTLADLIWDAAYRHAKETPNFEEDLRDRMAQIFQQCEPQVQSQEPICWQVMGVTLMTRALGVCLTPKDESSYQRIFKLRREIYQTSSLMALGVEQQYHLTAHITLGYFGDTPAGDRDAIAQSLIQLNDQWLEIASPRTLRVHRAELRKFDDMTRYYREPDWAVLEF